MDASFPVDESISQETVTNFFRHYLNFPDNRSHLTVLFYDIAIPKAFINGIADVEGTTLVLVDARRIQTQIEVIEKIWAPQSNYVSVHDYCANTFFSKGDTVLPLCEQGVSIDYTSFEFPRIGLTDDQTCKLLKKYTTGNPQECAFRADTFFSLLNDDPDYVVKVFSGPNSEHELIVEGPEPWMEVCGPLLEGDVRFAPGSELFRGGTATSGSLYCDGALNMLPLRGGEQNERLYARVLELGERIPEDPITLEISGSQIHKITSAGGLAQEFNDLLRTNLAFTTLVEVGLGLSDSCRPLERDWAATSNEGVPGIHLGLGADPTDTTRFETPLHLDFVAPNVKITVQGQDFFDMGTFCEAS